MAVENGAASTPSAGKSSEAKPDLVDGVTTAEKPASYMNREELLSLRVVTGNKRLFVALCENDRGRYLKISDGKKKLTVPESGISDLLASIDGLKAEAGKLPESVVEPVGSTPAPAEAKKSKLLHTERFIAGGRKFYLDPMQNEWGVFVKMSQASTFRTSIIFPSAALRHLHDALMRVIEMAPEPIVVNPTSAGHITRTIDRHAQIQAGGTVTIKAVQRELRLEGQRVIFESGANRRGSYLRIFEAAVPAKMSVTLPHSMIPQVQKILNEVLEAGDPLDDLHAAENAAATAKAAE